MTALLKPCKEALDTNRIVAELHHACKLFTMRDIDQRPYRKIVAEIDAAIPFYFQSRAIGKAKDQKAAILTLRVCYQRLRVFSADILRLEKHWSRKQKGLKTSLEQDEN